MMICGPIRICIGSRVRTVQRGGAANIGHGHCCEKQVVRLSFSQRMGTEYMKQNP